MTSYTTFASFFRNVDKQQLTIWQLRIMQTTSLHKSPSLIVTPGRNEPVAARNYFSWVGRQQLAEKNPKQWIQPCDVAFNWIAHGHGYMQIPEDATIDFIELSVG